jgi:predicted nucleotidyltransferase
LALLRRAGARNARVFGSVARGTDASTSDIDLLVELGPEASLLDLARLRRQIAELLGVPVDVATPPMLKAAVRERAEREAIPL